MAGLLLEREVSTLRGIVEAPQRPLVVVLGGAKVTDKIALIDRFLDMADALLIGGAMASASSARRASPTGDSLVEDEGVELARRRAGEGRGLGCRLLLPVDLVLGDRFDAEAERRETDGVEVPDGWMGLDVGPRTAAGLRGRRSRAPGRSSGTGRWGLRAGAVRGRARARVAEAVAGGAGHHGRGRRRLRAPRSPQFGLAERGGPPLDRRRRGAGAARRASRCRAWRRSMMR